MFVQTIDESPLTILDTVMEYMHVSSLLQIKIKMVYLNLYS